MGYFCTIVNQKAEYIILDHDKMKETMAIYDEHPEWLVPKDMLITDEDKLLEMGLAIKKLYTGGEPLADHLGDGIRVSFIFVVGRKL